MQNLYLLLLFTVGCWSQILPPCPPYAAFLPPEMLVGCSLPGPPIMPLPFLPQPYPMMPPMMPPAVVNITMPKHEHKTTTPLSLPTNSNYNNNSFHFPIPRMPMPFPPPMPMGPPMPMIPHMKMLSHMPMTPHMPMPLPRPLMPVKRHPTPSKDHGSSNQSINNMSVTPVLLYVARDGHVIYKKTLSDVEALRWLRKEIKKIRYQKTGGGKREDGNNSDSNRSSGEKERKI